MYEDVHLNKYLKKRSIHKVGEPHKSLKKCDFKFFIVIPCYNEFEYVFDTLQSIDYQDKKLLDDTLVVVVINNATDDSLEIKVNNSKTYDLLITKKYKFEFVVIDCFSQKNQISNQLSGVGYARKIGLDFSLNHILDAHSLFCFLDADTIVDKKYLTIIKNNFSLKNIDAAVINFKHQKSNNPIIEEGIRKYEFLLKNIAFQIEKTGSPYGYVSMGSTIVCNVKSYIACGGMNTKKATEDFYFLQSLAKYTNIHKIKDLLVFPSSRNENRVYLGTGFRMDEYSKNKTFKNLDFSNHSYEEIKKINKIINKNWKLSSRNIIQILNQELDNKSISFLNGKNIKNVLTKFKDNAKDKNQFLLFFNQWFDALSIMQFLKHLNNY